MNGATAWDVLHDGAASRNVLHHSATSRDILFHDGASTGNIFLLGNHVRYLIFVERIYLSFDGILDAE